MAESLLNGWLIVAATLYFAVKFLEWLVVTLPRAAHWLRAVVPVPAPVPVAGDAAAADAPPVPPAPAPAPPGVMHATIAVCVLALVALLFFGASGDLADPDAAMFALGPEASITAVAGLVVPYYTPWLFADAQGKRVPVADCAFYDHAALVQNSVLGPALSEGRPSSPSAAALAASAGTEMALPDGAGDYVRRVKNERTEAMLRRQRAAQHCGLNAARVETLTDRVNQTTFEPHIVRPVFWSTPARAAAVGLTDEALRVTSVIVTRNQTYYVRVAMVRQAPGAASYRLQNVLVDVHDLVRAVEQWYARLTELLGPSADVLRCLCVAHFGIVGSGLHVYHDTATGRWSLMLDASISFNVSFSEGEITEVYWRDRPLAFPAVVDSHYGVSRLRHHGKILVRHIGLDQFASEPFLRSARELDPTFDYSRESRMPLPLVVPLKALTPTTRRIDDLAENGCFQHCQALDRVSLERFRAWRPT